MRIGTYNILHGRSVRDGKVDVERFGAAVASLDADVLALQEVDRGQTRSHGADLASVAAEAMGATAHRFAPTLVGAPRIWSRASDDLPPGEPAYGIALLSRYPVLSWQRMPLPTLRVRMPVFRRDRLGPVLVRDEPRAALLAVVDAPGGPLTVVATHLTFLPRWNGVQLRRLMRGLRAADRPAVLMGDLNLGSERAAELTGWRSLADGATFPVQRPTRQIDHILADGPVHAVGEAESLDLGVSDHRALVVDVELRPTAPGSGLPGVTGRG